jgi:hypothetical protein
MSRNAISITTDEEMKFNSKKDLDRMDPSLHSTLDVSFDEKTTKDNCRLISNSLAKYVPYNCEIIQNESKKTIDEFRRLGYDIKYPLPEKEVIRCNSVFKGYRNGKEVAVKMVNAPFILGL